MLSPDEIVLQGKRLFRGFPIVSGYARAAPQRQSMQEFLRCELERIAARPSIEVWLQGVRDPKEASGARVRLSTILRARDTDRT
ncbi:MAG: hypothetical protein OXE44_15240 [Nitrospinae bacterium]|nr:hypothetical protein [Nitrospinota bacterium]